MTVRRGRQREEEADQGIQDAPVSEWFIGGHIVTRITLPQQCTQETRKRILDAASQVFGRRGCDGQATVEEIAAEADVPGRSRFGEVAQ